MQGDILNKQLQTRYLTIIPIARDAGVRPCLTAMLAYACRFTRPAVSWSYVESNDKGTNSDSYTKAI